VNIYLDNNATTALWPEVIEAMRPYWIDYFANPSSPYTFARKSSRAVQEAREQVASLLGCDSSRIVFTGGGSEANNAAMFMATALYPDRRHVVISAVEHASVLAYADRLEQLGYRVTRLPVNRQGCLDLSIYEKALTPDTALVSVMAANNETGVLFPVHECARMARERGVLFHCDATQAAGKIPWQLTESNIDLCVISGHKLHGPKGMGVLYVRDGLRPPGYVVGGDQEFGWRAGTENVPGIVGLGQAAMMARDGLSCMGNEVAALRNRLEQDILNAVPDVVVAGSDAVRLPNTSMLLFKGIESEALLALLDMENICCSSGSACMSGASEPSHVLRAMGFSHQEASGAVRFSLSRMTGESDIIACVSAVITCVKQLRGNT
jgi:cysteine desulfurase